MVKRGKRFLIALTIPFLALGCASTAGNDSAAKADTGGWVGLVPAGWQFEGINNEHYTGYTDLNSVCEGLASVTITSKIAQKKHIGVISQTIQARDFAGERVRLRVCLRTDDVGQRAGLWLKGDSQIRHGIAFDNMERRIIRGTKSWAEYFIVVDVPDNADYIVFGALLVGRGQLWIDDCYLEIVRKNIEITSLPVVLAPRQPFVRSKIINDEPLNMGFED